MRFEKWEGLGNDFVIVEGELAPEDARAICDRRRGVGADGLLLVQREPQLRMTVLNADGSRPEMCGNGLRCAAGWLREQGQPGDTLAVHTDAGLRSCIIESGADGEYQVQVDMGRARMIGELRDDAGRRYVHVDVGNPHAVSFEPHEQADLDEVGPAFQRSVDGGINVELCALRPSESATDSATDSAIDVIVWERGVGRTQACGTGACAVAGAAVHAGLLPAGRPIHVQLPGGALRLVVDDAGTVRMTGPARRVFRGEL